MPINKTTKVTGGVTGVAGLIIAAVFAVEGGYTNDSNDPGGETNHGITKTVAVQNGYTGPMKDLTQELAAQIYFRDYIQKPGYEPMLTVSPTVSLKLVDAAVNAGPGRSSVWFQSAINAYNNDGKSYPQINVDGKVGAGTINAYVALQNARGKVKACELMIKALDAQQGAYYLSLVKLKKYTVGWMDNRIGNVPLSKCQEDAK